MKRKMAHQTEAPFGGRKFKYMLKNFASFTHKTQFRTDHFCGKTHLIPSGT